MPVNRECKNVSHPEPPQIKNLVPYCPARYPIESDEEENEMTNGYLHPISHQRIGSYLEAISSRDIAGYLEPISHQTIEICQEPISHQTIESYQEPISHQTIESYLEPRPHSADNSDPPNNQYEEIHFDELDLNTAEESTNSYVEQACPNKKDSCIKNNKYKLLLGLVVGIIVVVITIVGPTAWYLSKSKDSLSREVTAQLTTQKHQVTAATHTDSMCTKRSAQLITNKHEGTTSPYIGEYNYRDALAKSILFLEAECSGRLPATNRIPWRGYSALDDRGNHGEDLTGGWYNGGDQVKFGFPMAWSVTTLAWGILDFREGYESAGQLAIALDSIKWPLDYFIKCHVSDTVFYGQVGDGDIDHAFWGRPEDMTMHRPALAINASSPGSDLAAETAAAMAASSIVFRDTDSVYADHLLSHGRRLYEFAYNHRGKYTDSINTKDFYRSSHYNDELAWGALWLARATGDNSYINKARQFIDTNLAWAYSWDNKEVGAQLLMYQLTNEGTYRDAVGRFLRFYMPGGGITYTPGGLAWRDKNGPLRYSANAAFIALRAADLGIMTDEAREFARRQINYALGDAGRSYVCGFGNNPPQRPHHRAASCNWITAPCDSKDQYSSHPNPMVLEGALVGGPGPNDDYEDRRDDYIKNAVACDYNAGFQGALAGLILL